MLLSTEAGFSGLTWNCYQDLDLITPEHPDHVSEKRD